MARATKILNEVLDQYEVAIPEVSEEESTSTDPVNNPSSPPPGPAPIQNPNPIQQPVQTPNQINTAENKEFDETTAEIIKRVIDEHKKAEKQKLHEQKLNEDPEYYTTHTLLEVEDFDKEDLEVYGNKLKQLIKVGQLSRQQVADIIKEDLDRTRAVRKEELFRKEAEISHFEKHVATTYGTVMGEHITTVWNKYMASQGIDPEMIKLMPYDKKVQSLKTFYNNVYLTRGNVSIQPEDNKGEVEINFSSLKQHIPNKK